MDYMFVLYLIAQNPTHLFNTPHFHSSIIDDMVAKRNNYVRIVNEAKSAWNEYADCIERGEDDMSIDPIFCDHDGLSFDGHHDALDGIENTQFSAENHIEALGNKIERLMRKKIHA